MENLGTLYVVAAPSGTGKTSLVRELVAQRSNLLVSISYTTRPKRPNEEHGKHYFFINETEFHGMKVSGLFLESANVFGYYYGTSKQWVQQQLQKGHDVILEIDWQGAGQIKALFPACTSIFILPPSKETLVERLKGRAQDDAEVIAFRMSKAKETVEHYAEFDYIVVNDRFEVAVKDLSSIITAQRLCAVNQSVKYKDLLAELLNS